MTDRVETGDAGELDEVVATRGAHLERMGEKDWFLTMQHADGSETAVWFTGKMRWERRSDRNG